MSTVTKVCRKCEQTKELSAFRKEPRNRSDGLHSYCRTCATADSRERHLVRKYGVTQATYTQMLTEQHGVCVICHRPDLSGRQLAVDHDHSTGAVRALLCQPCNTTLGLMQDSPDRLRAAAAYLELHRPAH